MGKHSAPKPPLPSAGAMLGTAVGVPAVLFTGISGVAGAAEGASTTSSLTAPVSARFMPPTTEELASLRACEASGRYSTNTGNGFYGAYQFDASTWRGLGFPGLPHQAAPSTQDQAAAALEEQRGWEPWPSCSRQLSLVPRRNHGLTVAQVLSEAPPVTPVQDTTSPASTFPAPTPQATTSQASTPQTSTPQVTTVQTAAAPIAVHATPAFSKVLTIGSATQYRSDVRLWQERMAQRGWGITVDGYFGAQSSAIARAFASEKGIHDGLPGEVDQEVWSAAWTLPVN